MNSIEEKIFKNVKFDTGKLISYGFKKEKDYFCYEKNILQNQFLLKIKILKDAKVISEVIDQELKEPFTVYKVENATGKFIGEVKRTVEMELLAIKKECTYSCVFTSYQAQILLNFAEQNFGGKPEFLWEKFNETAILRKTDNKKWYAVILKLNIKKLGLNEDKTCETIVLRGDSQKIDNKRIFSGYHMNKKNWISVILDGRLNNDECINLLIESFNRAK